ncbi:MAG: chromosome segregation protein SMC [Lachnospiraceae bacterium]|nr:chromosome segregation protein SMC [Lachnospiraceae bacterium]
MYLKSIEVQGFKSFAQKTVLQFNNGITGIVGPNGSGKSNVADAVRWVLGEQRIKQLRGASMQDVIFSGTELRKPVGSAYVAITLDNSDHSLAIDFDEVTVARRIYRSGESEYLINGTVCRLKDVNELFYDTGIGKEGYSIIGQGQIDKILSSKPEDRRELFDEAAGIVKFKRRKNETLKKLENERANLLRVTDILSELDRQIGPLEKQSEKAKIYLSKKEELKKLDINVFLLDSQVIDKKIKELAEKEAIARKDFDDTTLLSEKLKRDYEEVENILAHLDEEIEKNRSMLANTDVLREKLEGEIKVINEQILAATDHIEHLNERMNNLDTSISGKKDEAEKVLELKKQIDTEINDKFLVLEALKAELDNVQSDIETASATVEKGNSYIIELLNERAGIKADISGIDTNISQKNIRLSEINAKLLAAKSVEQKQNMEVKRLEDEFNLITEEIQKLNTYGKELDKKTVAFHEELTVLDDKLKEVQTSFHREKSKLDAISNLSERYDGFNSSIKKVMEHKASDKKILGVVADLIKVDSKYETAIEIALGGNIQNIVTEDEETAKKLINVLKTEKAGRATFLPLTSLTNPQEFKQPESLEEKGVIGMADEIVECDDKYRPVAKSLLGRILVVDNVDNALKIARKYEYGIRMVTLEGELLVPGGAISGGNFRNNSNLLGRRREIDELDKKVKELIKEQDKILEDIENVKLKRNENRNEIIKNKDNLQDAFIRQNSARINCQNAKEKMGSTLSDFEALREEVDIIKLDLETLEKEKTAKENLFKESIENEKNEKKLIDTKQAELVSLRSVETGKLENVQNANLVLEKLYQKQEFEQANLDRIKSEITRFENDKNEIINSRSLSDDEIERKKVNLEEIRETIKASFTSQSEAEKQLEDDVKKRDELLTKRKSYFDERDSITNRIAEYDKELFRLKTAREKQEENLAGFSSYIWQEYDITLQDAKQFRDEELNDLSAMKKQVSSIKDDIKKLGDVNVNAIEEYKEVFTRHFFLSSQHKDLQDAERDLVKIIDELDNNMRKQFAEQFGRISNEFDKVFKELFGGGKATLELLDDEDILEAGIRIIAQPPGKKLQNMMQLSGGEKALAAISLLFAIQNLKPSPFCLLDEIEAALDESNVDRFAKYLIKMTKNTQFIVITHRRGTMNKADQLYGITMQEKGVSALVSVDLIDKELEKEEKKTKERK